MRKQMLLILLLVCSLCVCSGCGRKEREEEGKNPNIVKLYFADETGTALVVKEHKKPKIESPADAAYEMIGWMRNKAQLEDDEFLAIPSEVAINNLTVDNRILRIDFAIGYEQLEKEKELLCRASLVKTLIQIPGIDYVEFTIGGTTMLDSDGLPIVSLTDESFMFDEIPMEKTKKY